LLLVGRDVSEGKGQTGSATAWWSQRNNIRDLEVSRHGLDLEEARHGWERGEPAERGPPQWKSWDRERHRICFHLILFEEKGSFDPPLMLEENLERVWRE
jgi:hypothetical protein